MLGIQDLSRQCRESRHDIIMPEATSWLLMCLRNFLVLHFLTVNFVNTVCCLITLVGTGRMKYREESTLDQVTSSHTWHRFLGIKFKQYKFFSTIWKSWLRHLAAITFEIRCKTTFLFHISYAPFWNIIKSLVKFTVWLKVQDLMLCLALFVTKLSPTVNLKFRRTKTHIHILLTVTLTLTQKPVFMSHGQLYILLENKPAHLFLFQTIKPL